MSTGAGEHTARVGDGPTPTAGSPPLDRVALDRVGLGLLGVSLAVSVALIGPLVRPAEVPVMILLTLLLVAYRVWLVAHGDGRVRRVGYWLGLPVSAALVAISPVFGMYAFLGYLELPLVASGRRRPIAVLLNAAIVAFAQLGGPRSPYASWPFYALLFVVNVAVVAVVHVVERQRERTLADLERTVAELRLSEERNAALQEQLIAQARDAGIQDERARVSREIHDTVAQGLVGIITQLEAAADTTDDGERAVRLDRAGAAAREALAEARRAVRALASPRLDTATLPHALADLVRQTGEASGLDARFVLDGDPEPTRGDAELLRVCQESLSNVLRHAAATRVVVTLGYAPDEVRLDVRDDGAGFNPGAPTTGRGLPGMLQRLAACGGTLEIETSTGGGCAVSAAIPR